jgi:signal transduction histidine kinase
MKIRVHLLALTVAVIAGGVLLVHDWDDPRYSTGRLLLVVVGGLVMAGAGVVARVNGEHRTGDIVVIAGAAWLLERALRSIPSGPPATLGALLTGLWLACLVHAVVGFPSGRLTTTYERALVGFGYFVNVGLNLGYLLVGPSLAVVGVTERNVLLVSAHPDAARRIGETTQWLTLIWAAVALMHLVARARRATPAARRAYGFAWIAGAVLCVNVSVVIAAAQGVFAYRDAYGIWLEVVAALVPVTLVLSLFVVRVAEDRLVALVADLDSSGPSATLRNAIRRTLADPSLEIVYLRAGSGGWVNELGIPAAAPGSGTGRASTPIVRDGKPVAALLHDPVLLRSPERLRAALGATALAIDNERLKSELRAQLHDVQASRTRIVEAADRERRRVERNLHDGAQQRLVGLALTLRLAGRRAEADPALIELLDEAARELDDALAELRELARGIHPAIVTDAGLLGALETLAERPGVPVDLSVALRESLPEHVSVGAYYVAAEALANASKHAGAGRVALHATVADDALHLAVTDDGAGGASARPGSGLEGLADRVSSLGGRLEVDSPVGGGTTIRAEIPIRAPRAPVRAGQRLAALRWVGWESWEVPAEAYDQLMDEDNLNHAKAVIACAGGVQHVESREREWLLGYHSAAGTAEWVLESIATYDAVDSIAEIMDLPSMTATRRGVLHDALRMCSADGPLRSEEISRLRLGSDAMGISEDVFTELKAVVAQEDALRHRRYELVVAPVLPAVLADAVTRSGAPAGAPAGR